MRSRSASLGGFPSWRMACTSRVMGMSTPCRFASPTAARTVHTPSATDSIDPSTSSSVFP